MHDDKAVKKGRGTGLGGMLRQIQAALVLIAIVPLLTISYVTLRYVSPERIVRDGTIFIFLAVMVLMLLGTRMVLRIVTESGVAEAAAAQRDRLRAKRIHDGVLREGRSIRNAMAEATALIGVIPMLALGYVVVRYAVPVHTTEYLWLLVPLTVVVLVLGIQRIHTLTARMLSVAAGARLVREETGVAPPRDYGRDEIGALSTDLGAIAGTLSSRSLELRRTRAFIEQLPHPFLAVNAAGEITLANPAAAAMLGFSEGELVGKSMEAIFEDSGSAGVLLREAERAGREAVWVGGGGKRVPVSFKSAVLRGDDFECGRVVIATDLTERKRLEKQLLHAQKMEAIGTLAGGLAHDFNNILAGIMGYVTITKDSLDPHSPLLPDMEAIEKLSWRGADITRALLAFARKGDFIPAPLCVNALIRDVLNIVGRTSGRHVDIRHDLDQAPLHVHGDKGQLHQVIMNLCINACEAMPRGGVMTVKTKPVEVTGEVAARHPKMKTGRHAMVSVTDTGSGIPREIQGRIFEPFFTTKHEKTGTGLGLSMVAGIVDRHGGYLEVRSGRGRGSTFTLYLPLTSEEVPGGSAAERGALEGSETVLIVDDEDDFRSSIPRWLEPLGYTTLTASCGEEALGIVRQRRGEVDVVLLDMIMRGMSGREVFGKLKEITPSLPVVICTGHALDDDSRDLICSGACDFIQKPFGKKSLVRALRKALDRAAGRPPA